MITPNDLNGCLTAVATPFDGFGKSPQVDYAHFERHITHLLECGVTKFVLAATTGMGSLLNEKEHVSVVAFGAKVIRDWCEKRSDANPIIVAGAGSNCTAEAVDRTISITSEVKVDAVLHTTGYYVGATPQGLRSHFTTIAEAASVYDSAVILYNVPSRTGVNFGIEVPIFLSNHPNIIGLKEASGNLKQIRSILENTDRDSFAVLSGEDHEVVKIIELGGIGVISASANIWPKQFLKLTELALSKRWSQAMELQNSLLPCIRAIFPPCVKNPQTIQHMLETGARLPLMSINQLDPDQRDVCLCLIRRAMAIKEFPHMKN